MRAPYPDIVFHFTKREGLYGIIKDSSFKLSYAKENIEYISNFKEFAIPIVAFCDLRISELPFHMKKYGNFGIGLTKEWAQENGLNPVAYMNKKSELTNNLIEAIEHQFKLIENPDDPLDDENRNIYFKTLNVLRYIKNYEGILIRNNKRSPKTYRFADEREWRYVLPFVDEYFLNSFASIKLLDEKGKTWLNNTIDSHRLNFSPSDIKYIIVPNEKNIRPIRTHIENEVFDDKDKQHLLTRILTAAQIKLDM